MDASLLRVVPTAGFEGIAGYARHAPALVRANWPVIRDAVAGADLAWIKAPASNAPLAAWACRRSHVPRFTWVAGSVREVVAGQRRGGPAVLAAGAVALAYDATTRLLERTGPSVRLDDSLFTSTVTAAEVDATRAATWHGAAAPARDGHEGGAFRLIWAGRVAAEKGLDDLLEALALAGAAGPSLDVVGDGPARAALEARAASLGLGARVRWLGYVADRRAYLDALRAGDAFVLSSRAEGLPKVVVDAMAAGLPVVATRVGRVPALLGDGARGLLVPPRDPVALEAAVRDLAADAGLRSRLREAGLAFASEHTAEAQAARLVAWLRARFPQLPWLPPPVAES